ncbi:hypothetical protein ACHAPJ_007984 [Fusarium lateritium]
MTSATNTGNNLSMAAPRLVPTIHKGSYPSLLPSRPEMSQTGRTILITGGSAGIGLAIARAYAAASASRVILTGRRSETLQDATLELTQAFPKVDVIPHVCDVADTKESSKLWSSLSEEGISVDVLVLNAAKFGDQPQPLLEGDLESTWSLYETNVKSLLNFAQQLHKQQRSDGKKKYIVYVSTAAIHSPAIAAALPDYSLSKISGHFLLQSIAEEVDREKLQIVSFHPGQILSEKARSAGLNESSAPFDNENLPGHWAVWAATLQAAFLHGRFAWAAWDINDLVSGDVRKRIDNEKDFLTLKLVGL